MAAPQKFLFDTSFDQTVGARAAPPKPVEPTFSQGELEAARAAALAQGRATGAAEALAATEARAAMALEAIASDLAKLGAAHAAAATQVEREAVGVLRAVLQKAMPALSRKEPLGEIEALVAECLREAIEEPRIVVRVADQLFEAVQRRLAPLAAAAGYAGKFVLLADDALGLGDCRVEWADGGAERDQKRLLNDLDAAFVRALATLDAAAPTFAQETTHE